MLATWKESFDKPRQCFEKYILKNKTTTSSKAQCLGTVLFGYSLFFLIGEKSLYNIVLVSTV